MMSEPNMGRFPLHVLIIGGVLIGTALATWLSWGYSDPVAG